MKQIKMFETHFANEKKERDLLQSEELRREKFQFWSTHFNWKATVNKIARIDQVIGYCKTTDSKGYAYCMEIKIVSITNNIAQVETTQNWAAATSGTGYNKQGLIWSIPVENLGPPL